MSYIFAKDVKNSPISKVVMPAYRSLGKIFGIYLSSFSLNGFD